MTQPETPNRVEFGERYGDDSGWEKFIAIDRHAGEFEIEIMASKLKASASTLPWLIETLTKAHEIAYGFAPPNVAQAKK